MDIILICLAAFITSILTFFSGFGLGTILTPVFILFFPIDLAIALTGVVHFFNNIFKLFLVGKQANRKIVFRFGLPAILAAFAGAWVLINITDLAPLYSYTIGANAFEITPIKLIISLMLITFSLMDLIPFFDKIKFGERALPLGGTLSGFFGGLSGHQGALRSAFLIKAGLSKDAYIGTSVVIACFIDFTRLGVYSTRFGQSGLDENLILVLSATLSAIAGAYLGNQLIKKVTLIFVQRLVAFTLILISLALGIGLI
ncbi:MAG: sulfite exporter TauE/SafE family protein [Flammeovirgaceae bacterium]|nr:sulfite exporter TauE/SafE family protein [Flammeovirgaceae bacterium]